MYHARTPFNTEAESASPRPQLSDSSGCGSMKRGTAVQMMATAAARIRKPSKPLEKYSAL